MRDWVEDGGLLIVTGSDRSYETDFLNLTFNWDLVSIEAKGNNSYAWTINPSNTVGTPFQNGPSSLPYIAKTTTIGAGSVSHFTPIYGTADDAAVAVIPYGSGQVIFLGHDFYNSGIQGTGIASSPDTHYGTDVLTGATNGSDWVQKIIPMALDYSDVLTATGSLTISDQDVNDTVSISVNSVTYSGDIGGFHLSNQQLLSLMKVDGGLSNSAETNTIKWSFYSDFSDDFSHLDPGESMKLTYTLRATDSRGETDDHSITITLKSQNSSAIAADLNDSVPNSMETAAEASMMLAQVEEETSATDPEDTGNLVSRNNPDNETGSETGKLLATPLLAAIADNSQAEGSEESLSNKSLSNNSAAQRYILTADSADDAPNYETSPEMNQHDNALLYELAEAHLNDPQEDANANQVFPNNEQAFPTEISPEALADHSDILYTDDCSGVQA